MATLWHGFAGVYGSAFNYIVFHLAVGFFHINCLHTGTNWYFENAYIVFPVI